MTSLTSTTGKTRTTRFRHDDAAERPEFMPARVPYEGINLSTANVVPQRVASVELHARVTLGEMRVAVEDDRYFGIGITGRDLVCAHEVRIHDRMGHGRCTKCHGWLFCASWVIDGWMGDATVEFANNEAARMAVRCEEGAARTSSQQRIRLNVVAPAQEPLFE